MNKKFVTRIILTVSDIQKYNLKNKKSRKKKKRF